MKRETLFCDQCGAAANAAGNRCSGCGNTIRASFGGGYLWMLLLLTMLGVTAAWAYANRDRESSVAAVVNGVPIQRSEIEERAAVRERLAGYHGRGGDLDSARLRWEILNEVLANRLVETAARDAGISLADGEWQRLVREYRETRGLTAEASFEQHVAAWYGSREIFRDFLRGRILFERLMEREGITAAAGGELRERQIADWFGRVRERASVQVFMEPPVGTGNGGCCGGGTKGSCCSTNKVAAQRDRNQEAG